MIGTGWDVRLCPTEADIMIAADCIPQDIVISKDSDLLVFGCVQKLWRPVGSWRHARFLTYDKGDVLAALKLTSEQLTVLAIVSKNDYNKNIPSLGIETNYKIVKHMSGDGGVEAMVNTYLSYNHVQSKNVRQEDFANAIRVFVRLTQNPVQSTCSLPDSNVTYVALQTQMADFLDRFDKQKKIDLETRRKKK
ncbi:hypothetical protein BGZ50_001236, partial [Haplosporangium sp. Z 11]